MTALIMRNNISRIYSCGYRDQTFREYFNSIGIEFLSASENIKQIKKIIGEDDGSLEYHDNLFNLLYIDILSSKPDLFMILKGNLCKARKYAPDWFIKNLRSKGILTLLYHYDIHRSCSLDDTNAMLKYFGNSSLHYDFVFHCYQSAVDYYNSIGVKSFLIHPPRYLNPTIKNSGSLTQDIDVSIIGSGYHWCYPRYLPV